MTNALLEKHTSNTPADTASSTSSATPSATSSAHIQKTSGGSTGLDLSATPSTRNRAIDAYRAVAMCAVALGHWLAADVRVVDGSLTGGNALNSVPQLHILTWLFQVMPVFFCIGGFSNAASLDAHHRAGRSNGSWVRARLSRLTSPSIWLAGTWLIIVCAGYAVGQGTLVGKASGIAAIPLWFLANYVADTSLAPITLRLYRKYNYKFIGGLVGVFAIGEAARFPKIHYAPQMNIVIGWLLFQVLGFAWKDGHLPTGRTLFGAGVACWAICGSLVAFGPWPLAMVSVPGAQFANTWPPSLALMFYGFGLCSFAIGAAPAISAFLTRNAKAWKAVVVANTMTMTSYLWHFTALAIAAFGLSKTSLLPTAAAGSGAWWLQKLPVMGVALVVLSVLVALLSGKERSGLLNTTKSAAVADPKALAIATGLAGLALAAGFEIWTAGDEKPAMIIPGMSMVLIVHFALRFAAKHFTPEVTSAD
jgi:hypothetical protein